MNATGAGGGKPDGCIDGTGNECGVQGSMKHDEYLKRRDELLQIRMDSFSSFDKAILSLATGSLALSIAFLDKIGQPFNCFSFVLILFAWIFFFVVILFNLASYLFARQNMDRKIAELAIDELQNILAQTLTVNDAVDWDVIGRKDAFRVKPEELCTNLARPGFITFNNYGRPVEYQDMDVPVKPDIADVRLEYGLLSRLFRRKAIRTDFDSRLRLWCQQVEETERENVLRKSVFGTLDEAFAAAKNSFEEEKQRDNNRLEDIRLRYTGGDPKAVEEYCDLVLNSSRYPDCFPKDWVLEYRPETRTVVVAYYLPSPRKLPKIKSYKYVKSKDAVVAQETSAAEQKQLYESVIYQVCIRTIHELVEADVVNGIDAVAFNGLVTHTNPATGIKETKVILSVMADKTEFLTFDLSRVDAKATFKHLKGVAAATLIDLTPIPPVIHLNTTDKRFIDAKAIAAELDESVNLAAMDWEDFEHLIRELFEKEFASSGGEVKVTQASSDGGVDAIAFDPDPIRGGKIVIQAKRYTNTVGVAAVRDLYGTILNEGATKGILVTTSDYGKDSYAFAKDKPMTLLSGSNLLALLEKHGHRARINVTEAKQLQKGQRQQ
ncbi:MAG: restriction endonuclease [Sedimentisphaerales bacterium]|nr:restriction endonuclease [Sedimentisphaerales bacterium]